ncbi:Uncharacterised protein [Candidatus Gugararchaeum adminiculabundum]|nr:Uncharacterised protein [Candidatus Gugararchaeum adminiculabundum]
MNIELKQGPRPSASKPKGAYFEKIASQVQNTLNMVEAIVSDFAERDAGRGNYGTNRILASVSRMVSFTYEKLDEPGSEHARKTVASSLHRMLKEVFALVEEKKGESNEDLRNNAAALEMLAQMLGNLASKLEKEEPQGPDQDNGFRKHMLETVRRIRSEPSYAARLRHDLFDLCANIHTATSLVSVEGDALGEKMRTGLLAEYETLHGAVKTGLNEKSSDDDLLRLAGMLLEYKRKYLEFAKACESPGKRGKAVLRAERLDLYIAELKGERDREHVPIDLTVKLTELIRMRDGKVWLVNRLEQGLWVSVSEFGLNRTLDNLISNALEAARKTGAETAMVVLSREGDYAVVKVKNVAILDEEARELINSGRIFEKGVSTSEGKGHGYGLLTARVFAQKNDARVRSGVLDGDIVEIEVRIPVCEPPAA